MQKYKIILYCLLSLFVSNKKGAANWSNDFHKYYLIFEISGLILFTEFYVYQLFNITNIVISHIKYKEYRFVCITEFRSNLYFLHSRMKAV